MAELNCQKQERSNSRQLVLKLAVWNADECLRPNCRFKPANVWLGSFVGRSDEPPMDKHSFFFSFE